MAADRLELAQQFSKFHPEEAAEVINHLPRAAAVEFLEKLEAQPAAALLNAMLVPAAAQHLTGMARDKAVAIITAMTPQRAAGLLRVLPAELRRDCLDEQTALRRSQIQIYLLHAKGIVGAWIESDVLTVRATESLADLRDKFALYEGDIPLAYVLDGEQAVLGTVTAAALVSDDEKKSVSALVKPVPEVLRARASIEIAVEDPAWRKSDILPVAESSGEFLGIVRYATLRHAVDEVAEYPAVETSGFATLGLAEAWFLGLSDLLGVALNRASRTAAVAPVEEGEPQ